MLRTALALAERKLHVFPCLPRGKEPATSHGCKDATVDPERIRQWWQERPDCNIGVATGAISNVMVVDVDGFEAEAELRRLEAENTVLPLTVETITARGRHLYFRYPQREVRNSAGRIAPGIDIRGDGGYTLCPPSVHPSGRRYCWSVDSASTFAEPPEWLLARIGARSNGNGKVAPTPSAEWRDLVCGGVGEGQRNQSITRISGYLLRHHIDPLVALEIANLWNSAKCRPPLDDAEVAGIVNSVSARELKRRNQ